MILGILGLYLVASVPAAVVLRNNGDPSFHEKLTESIMGGHLDIRPVPAGLLDLGNPYDPATNTEFRFQGGAHDLALYEGRLYSLHGPVQAVLLNVPFRLMGLQSPPDYLATLLFAALGFLATVWIIAQLRTRFMPTLPVWAECSMIAAVGLATPVWWILTVGRAYESSIASAYCLTMAGLALMLRATREPEHPDRWLLAGGALSLALAVGTRPAFILAAAYLALAAIVILQARRRAGSTSGLGLDVAAMAGPYLLIIALLGAYNAARFGSPTEFGTQYQLSVVNLRTYPLMQPSYLWPNLRDYLVAPPRLEAKFPFVYLLELTKGIRIPGQKWTPDITAHSHEPVAGVMALYPVIPVGLVVCAANARRMWRQARPLALMLGLSVALALVMLVAISLPFNTSTMRYTVDFAPLLILAASIGWGWSFTQFPDRVAVRRVLAGAWVAALGLSILFGVLLALTPCGGTGSC